MVELLVAMVVGLFLMGGIIQMLVASKASNRFGEAESRVQENGRFAVQMIAADLRRVRGTGCASIVVLEGSVKREGRFNVVACSLRDPDSPDATATSAEPCPGGPALGSKMPLGFAASKAGSANWLRDLPGTAVAGVEATVASQWLRGDVLVSWGATGAGQLTRKPDAAATLASPIELFSPEKDLVGGRLALATDCSTADVFVVTTPRTCQDQSLDLPTSLQHEMNYDSDGTPEACGEDASPDYTDKSGVAVNASGELGRLYNSTGTTVRAMVFPFEYNVYYVCCMDSRYGTIQSGSGVAKCNENPSRYRPSLCRWSTATNNSAEQTVSDIADIRVLYDGFTNDVAGDRFLDLQEAVTDADWISANGYWDRVDSARIQLLATTAEEVRTEAAAPNPEASAINDVGFRMAADRRIYHVFDVTTAIRSNSTWLLQP